MIGVTKQRGFLGGHTKQTCEVLSLLRNVPPQGLGRAKIMKRTGYGPGPIDVILAKHEKAGYISRVLIDDNGNVVEKPVACCGSRYLINWRITEEGKAEYRRQSFL